MFKSVLNLCIQSYSYYKPRKSYYRRYHRSVEDKNTVIAEHEAISNAILDASLNDAEDCAKKLVCSLNSQDVNTLASDEAAIVSLFGKAGFIDVEGIVITLFFLFLYTPYN